MRKSFVWALFLTVALLSGCRSRQSTDTSLDKTESRLSDKNVVFIVIDTLRADHLPFHGYHKNTAPFLNSIAEKGIVFDRAIAPSSTTAPSTASYFTSLYPSQHGVVTGHILYERMKKEHEHITMNRLPKELITLGEFFKSAGYRTLSVSDNLNICREMSYDRGFDRFETYQYEGAHKVNAKLKEWAPEVMHEGKYFAYIHYMDPHKPYNQRDPWFEPSKSRNERIISAYDSEISYSDQHIREMFELFGWSENTLLIITSDHGEEFWEHGGDGHGKTLYREVIHVPLVIYYPGIEPRRVTSFVHLIDIFPTFAELLSLPKSDHWQGVSLTPLMRGEPLAERPLFSELLRRKEHPRPARRSVIKNNWHLISTRELDGEMTNELYNLVDDFTEQNNLFEAEPEIAARLLASFETLNIEDLKISKEEVHVPVDDESLEKLRTLGYVN